MWLSYQIEKSISKNVWCKESFSGAFFASILMIYLKDVALPTIKKHVDNGKEYGSDTYAYFHPPNNEEFIKITEWLPPLYKFHTLN